MAVSGASIQSSTSPAEFRIVTQSIECILTDIGNVSGVINFVAKKCEEQLQFSYIIFLYIFKADILKFRCIKL